MESTPDPDYCLGGYLTLIFHAGVEWVTEREAINSLNWENSCLTASPGTGRAYHPEVKAGTSRESGLDVAFLSSVCLGMKNQG